MIGGAALLVATIVGLIIWGLNRGNNDQQARADDRPRAPAPDGDKDPRSNPKRDNQPPSEQRPKEEPANDPPQPPAKRVVAKPWEPNPNLFLTVRASDGTFTVLVPHGWTVKSANMDRGLNNGLTIWGPKGDRVFQHAADLNANQETLTPVEAVRDHYAKLYAPLIQGVRILDSKEVPVPPAVAQMAAAFRVQPKAALVQYQYTFKSNDQADRWKLALFPPALMDPKEVVMKGRAEVLTLPPPVRLPNAPIPWMLSLTGVEAPADLFDKNQFFYEYIARSIKEDPVAVMRKVGRKVEQDQAICQAFLRAGPTRSRRCWARPSSSTTKLPGECRTTWGSIPSARRKSTRCRPAR
jgi:hypothetical protein